MGGSWEDSYTGQLRKRVGHQKLIIPSVRAVILNEQGDALYIARRGEGSWGMPAGSIELEETIFQCLQREVLEETGLRVLSAVPFAVYTSPDLSITNRFGDAYQLFEFAFRVEEWTGELVQETDETVGAKFFPLDDVPEIRDPFWKTHHERVIADLKAFQGQLLLK
ncbi:ADP-ribose pyrophosphatase YjhB (NUDIX family) [Tumebacillus sp. BK434]|uniref:NUDIX domain-containing protein n=1 Tax=Tumebacillus sp. BK434 TaxID=2512169 RepID=UPI00104D3B0B|nr:NUDIX domain-containing protein [Tumebacillus sp. BK434]TCP53430.1 ADP-ribose pyrophosphatase YjhB (NUDIX family) [Tumebacillus sp. BK434]